MDITDERQSFLFYESYRNAAKRMTNEQRVIFYELIFDYGLKLIEPNDTGDVVIDIALDFVRPLIKANIRNWENGKKGGASSESMKGNQNAKKGEKTNRKQTQNKPKQTENKGNDNVNVNVNVNDNDNDNDITNYSDLPTASELFGDKW